MKQLGINPAMDELSRKHNLGHWSCVSPCSAHLWLRSDGVTFAWDDAIGNGCVLIDELKREDNEFGRVGKDWQQQAPAQPIRSNAITAIQDMLSTGTGVTNHQFFDTEMYGEVVKGIADRVAPEKTIVSNGCHDCLLFFYSLDTADGFCKLNNELYCTYPAIEKYRHCECPLLTHSIRVIKNDQ